MSKKKRLNAKTSSSTMEKRVTEFPRTEVVWGMLTEESRIAITKWVQHNLTELVLRNGGTADVDDVNLVGDKMISELISVGYDEGYDSASQDIGELP